MIFKKSVPKHWGYYWCVDKGYPEPFIMYFHKRVDYPPNQLFSYIHCVKRDDCRWEEFIGEHPYYRFGDKIDKPNCVGNVKEYEVHD